jgi:hypothetical protein
VQVLGPHGDDRLGQDSVSANQLEDLWDAHHGLWHEHDVPEALVAHAVREGLGSELVTGWSKWADGEISLRGPESWSPLGDLRPEGFGRFQQTEGRGGPDDEAGVRYEGAVADDAYVLSFRVDGEVVSSMAFDGDAFVVPVPAAAVSIGIEPVDRPDVWQGLEAFVDGSRHELVVWRVYSGDNSWVRDAVTRGTRGLHRVTLRGLEGVGLAVGRVLRVVANRVNAAKGYPLYARSLRKAETLDPATRRDAPRLGGDDAVDRAMVVVHGTMSNGMALARAALRVAAGTVAVRRFEHDTWLPMEQNAQELVEGVGREVTGEVIFVAHSRGGLVAARAAAILDRRDGPKVTGLVTLGTPSWGTPMIATADVGFLGVRALMGGLRFGGGPVVDVTTRLAGLALHVRTPPGLRVMDRRSEVLPLLRDSIPGHAITFAATADGSGADCYGLAMARGVGRSIFDGEPNDLVVSVGSARLDDVTPVLDTDHFSYLEQADVLSALSDLVHRSPPTTLTWYADSPGQRCSRGDCNGGPAPFTPSSEPDSARTESQSSRHLVSTQSPAPKRGA